MLTSRDELLAIVDCELLRMASEANSLLAETGTERLHERALVQTGKLLRPRLVFSCALHAADAAGGDIDWPLARTAALALELAHVGTLYHDDIVDQSPTRRGHAAVYREHGTVTAAYGGAHLLVLANGLVSGFPDQMVRDWALAANRVADGQTRELDNAGNCEVEPEEYVRIAQKKTGALFQLAAQFGSYCGGGRDRAALSRFGRCYGTSFQLLDDIADFTRPTSSHRVAVTDLRNRTYTLPVLYGLRGKAGDVLIELLRNDGYTLTDSTVVRVCESLRDGGDFAAAEARAQEECDAANAAIRGLTPTVAREHLFELVVDARNRGRASRSAA